MKREKLASSFRASVSKAGEGAKVTLRSGTNAIVDGHSLGGTGTGLGMAISYRIVQEHGGSIDVASREGIGTTITVWSFTPSSCGKYWVELLNIGFGSQPSGYHVIVAAVTY